MKIAIIYQDADVLVVDKPAKLDVYDLEAELKQEYPEIALAHRLDRDTTGVLILAKHPAALAHLRAEFKARRVKKTYRTIVNSSLPAEGGRNTGTINVPIGRHPSDARRRDTGKRAVEPRREAMTHYQILKHLPGYTYLEVRPATGRTHQIRVHFKHLGHAVANDKLYAPMAPRLSGIHRQALHAYKLKLKLPNGHEQEFTAPLPEDFCAALASLGESC